MRVAFVSTDGTSVDEHFGKARRFLVYDVTDAGFRLVAERPVSPLSTGDPSHAFDVGRFVTVAEALEDCERIYCTQVGPRPAEELETRGVQVVRYAGPIEGIPL